MTKTAAIFHGSGGSENSYWIPWLKGELQKNEYEVWTPSLSDCDGKPDLDEWVEKVESLAPRKHFDLMVGHSSGVPLILKLLSKDFKAGKAIDVGGYMRSLETYEMTGFNYDFENIKAHCPSFTFIHSDNDPWGCNAEKQGEFMRQTLGGTLITVTGEGHFGSDSFNQPYKTFPLLLAHCLLEGD